MATAKDLVVAPISSADARAVVLRTHYSGTVVRNSQLHLGVFMGGKLEGAMQFGPSLDKSKIIGLVSGTKWNGFIELNRMAFTDRLPRNSESRAIGVAMRMIRRHYPHIEWVVSFADGTQCGDGTIYRASGFVLTAIKKNSEIWAAPDGETFSRLSLTDGKSKGVQNQAGAIVNRVSATKGRTVMHSMSARGTGSAGTSTAMSKANGAASMKAYAEAGFKPLDGYQLRYIYFLNPCARERLTVPVVPFAKIAEMNAGMYRGEKVTRGKDQDAGHPPALGGETPTPALHSQGLSAGGLQ